MSGLPAKFDVGIVGLGYVGLTLATVLAEAGNSVIGVEKRRELVDMTNEGIPHFTETGLPDALSGVTRSKKLVAAEAFDDSFSCDVYIITVGTPLAADGVARVDMIEAAARDIAANMQDGALVILRSTVKIGTTRDVVAPILEASGKRFDIAMCPERTLEGKALQELRELPQIIGADSQEVADRAAAVFRKLTNSIVGVSSIETAEIIKLISNTFRDVQFAFANEVARVCDAFGVSAHEVISSGKLGYNRTNIPLPGLVGGPCLEKDPHILMESARTRGVELEITSAGRVVNERQPEETVAFINAEIARRGLPEPLKINLVGMAFKGQPETSDLRGSMSIKVLDALKKAHPEAEIGVYDPVTPQELLAEEFPDERTFSRFGDAVSGASVLVIGNNHPSLGTISPRTIKEFMSPEGFVFDYWNHFSHLPPSELGDSYFAVGRSGAVGGAEPYRG
ncbi:nucleotide sugar dehydrogenase [Mycolicibacterium grossiae]|uniref:Nucleotide sugar dehydrogenase n=2 Tax=Mycolicibacterium grossiae TaxID=1552759 RepID=A0A1E8Q361_9MYCO|nr:nucleotide sugar dehydrogenase [Mycolicibacterium grossiae]OFJ52480.1 nucleotide sugar dehydrogenase [Mycolicibacterium grossiae]QEM45569.1 nucleotide sugar dehydrogenase [Mycolicibacterium grossiae]